MKEEDCYPIGIDLGTTYSCVGVYRNERAEILSNDQGNYTTPSCVAFSADRKLYGEAAQNQAALNVCNTVFSIKRMIGRNFDEPQVQTDMKQWPFAVKNKDGTPVIEVHYQGRLQEFSPTEISAMVLLKMKNIAEAKLGTVKDAVITVPAYFDNGQRQATKDAGVIAGLNVLRILSEPTAAALAYGIDSRNYESKTILVYDLGGGTFDISILAIQGDEFKVLATSGDTHLGGEDFDTRIVDHFVNEIKLDIRKNMKAMRRLRTACERAKRTLSVEARADLEIDALYEGIDFQSTLTRAKFNEICGDLFLSTIQFIEKILIEAKLNKSQIDEVVLSGGSSRIIKIQELVSEFFGGKRLNKTINLDEAVAMGACIQANILKGSVSQRIRDIQLVDVTPLSLGVESKDDVMSFVVEKNSAIPLVRTKNFTTSSDYQTAAGFSIYEGESRVSKENLLLGNFILTKIQVALECVPNFLVTFKIDLDGILHVSATDQVTGSSNEISITNYRGHLTREQIEVMSQRTQS